MNLNSKRMLTIAIPLYNSELSISRLIDSVIKQRCNNTCILLIDDGSTDSTVSIVSNYVDEYDWISLFKNGKNQGLDKNYIKCIELCESDYIWIVGHDDYLPKGALNRVHKEIEYGSKLIYCNFSLYDSNLLSVTKDKWINVFHKRNESKGSLLKDIGLSFTFISSMVFYKPNINVDSLNSIDVFNWMPAMNVMTNKSLSDCAIIAESVVVNAGSSLDRPWNRSGSAIKALRDLDDLIYEMNQKGEIDNDTYDELNNSLKKYLRRKVVSAILNGYKHDKNMAQFIYRKYGRIGYYKNYKFFLFIPHVVLRVFYKLYKTELVQKLYWSIKTN